MPNTRHASGSSFHGAGQSNVGLRAIYEADNQRNEPRAVTNERDRYRDGKYSSNQSLSTNDEFVVASKFAEQERSHKRRGQDYSALDQIAKIDPTRPASLHGHEPSQGAWIDKELMEEDDQRLRAKGLK